MEKGADGKGSGEKKELMNLSQTFGWHLHRGRYANLGHRGRHGNGEGEGKRIKEFLSRPSVASAYGSLRDFQGGRKVLFNGCYV